MNWSAMLADIRHSVRMLLKTPGFTAVAILTITLGVGTNTAMFSEVDALLLRPSPYQHPDRIVVVWNTWPQRGFPRMPLFNAEFHNLQRSNHVFGDVAGFKPVSANLTGVGEPERLDGARASASLFSILGVDPLIGRTFSRAEDTPGANRVVMLS
jgi:putative ABC transport system permease protein